MNWVEQASKYAMAAERAFLDGDKVAGSELLAAAAAMLKIARNLETAQKYLDEPRKRSGAVR